MASSNFNILAKKLVLTVAPEIADKQIRWRILVGKSIWAKIEKRALNQVHIVADELKTWDEYNSVLLGTIFTTDSFAKKYRTYMSPFRIKYKSVEQYEHLEWWYRQKQRELESIKDQLELYEQAPQPVTDKPEPVKSFGNKVFIVHGRDEAIRESVARMLEILGINYVILHEQPDMGKTVIEKLETNASEVEIGFAVIILTGDDMGKLASEQGEPSKRARQNVILELGYFMAKLGRQRVHVIYEEGVELPSDYHGVLYTKIDKAGAWKFRLAKELKAVGFDIDLNELPA